LFDTRGIETADGHVSVYSDHIEIGQDGEEAVVESVRLARFSPEKLVSSSGDAD
jgi:hypothetical protein